MDNNSETVLKIDDFRELGYEYLDYIGDGKFIRCECCKKFIRKKSNKQKYCTDCYKRINSDMTNERQKKKRKNFF